MNRKFKNSLISLIQHNKEGSFSTFNNRQARLLPAMAQLSEKYARISDIRELKTTHIEYLVNRWKNEKLNIGTIKNRMTDLRWIAQKIDKQNIVKKTNYEYDIENRQYVNNKINIAKILTDDEINAVSNEFIRYSLKLQREFGLRREESIKFRVNDADQGHQIALKASWCKGGRARMVPIRNNAQRALLDEIKRFCKAQAATALIPKESNYKQQMKTYENHTIRNEIFKNHGLRHAYAQNRYLELTQRQCPKNGGKTSGKLTAEEKAQDHKARLQISSELGHAREEITAVYLGR